MFSRPAAPLGCVRHPDVAEVEACTYCRRPFCANCIVPLKGQRLCAECKHAALCRTFRHDPWADYTIRVESLAPDVGEGAGELQRAPCALHAGNVAVAACERCGDFMCPLCDTNFEGRRYCARCLDLLWTRGNLVPPPSSGYSTASLVVGLLSLLFFCVWLMAVPMGLTAIGLGIAGLNQIAKKPETPGKASAITGIVTGGIALVISILIIAMGLSRL